MWPTIELTHQIAFQSFSCVSPGPAAVSICKCNNAASLPGEVAGHQVSIVWNVVREQLAQALDVVAPITVQLAGDAEPVHRLHAGLCHPEQGCVADIPVESARRVHDYVHFIARLDC